MYYTPTQTERETNSLHKILICFKSFKGSIIRTMSDTQPNCSYQYATCKNTTLHESIWEIFSNTMDVSNTEKDEVCHFLSPFSVNVVKIIYLLAPGQPTSHDFIWYFSFGMCSLLNLRENINYLLKQINARFKKMQRFHLITVL